MEIFRSKFRHDPYLQAYWRLESDGTDSSGNGYTIAAGAAPEGYVAAKFGNGADFEATNSDYLTIADAACPNLEIAGSQTWSLWYKPESYGNQRLMGKWPSGAGNIKNIQFDGGVTNKVTFTLSGLSTPNVASSNTINTGNWHHIVGVYDSSAGKLKIFVDGTKTEANTSGSAADIASAFSVGRAGERAFDYADGLIDDVGIWNRALTDAEVTYLYSSGGVGSAFILNMI